MKKKWRVMLSVIATLFLLGLVMVPAVLADATATRDIADQTLDAGQSTTVTVTIDTDEYSLVLTEEVPAGWVVSDAEASGADDVNIAKEATGEFLWLNTDESALGTVTATYTLTVPSGAAADTYYIDGTVMDDEENIWDVGGESAITVSGVPAPPGTTAERDIADQSLLAGESTTVTVTIDTDEYSLVLTEEVPAGWEISDAEASGADDVNIAKEATGEFLWLNTDESALGTVTATYTLTVPLGAAAVTYYIDGTVMDDEENTWDVGGESAITVGEAPVPGDYPVLSWWLTTL